MMHSGNSLDSGNYFSDVFDVNTGIWFHCDDNKITQISYLKEGVYNRESPKQKYTKKNIISG